MFTKFMQLLKIFLLLAISTDLAFACLKVCENQEEYFKSDLIDVREYDCDSKNECLVVVEFPSTFNGKKFSYAELKNIDSKKMKLIVSLKVLEGGEKNQTSVYGQKSYLENFEIHIAYSSKDGCFYNSFLELKHNKLKNVKASVAGPDAQQVARPF